MIRSLLPLRWLCLSLCVLGSACATLPRPGAPAMRDIAFSLREFKLSNGLRIVVEEDHSRPLVGLVNVVGVGASEDPPGKEGLAHFVEHLAFRTKLDGKSTVWEMLEYAGAAGINAGTGFDTTTYYELAPRDALQALLTIEGSRMLHPVLNVDPEVFEVERELGRRFCRGDRGGQRCTSGEGLREVPRYGGDLAGG